MFKRIAFGLAVALILFAGNARAQGYIPDHCLTGLHQNFTSGSISSATTTSLIAPITGANIYICQYVINQAGGSSTSLQLEYGTGSTCGTGSQTLSALFTAPTTAGTGNNTIVGSGDKTLISTNAGAQAMVPSQRLCVVTVGSTVQSIAGTFVQE